MKIGIALALATSLAQTPLLPMFDVASVKPNTTGGSANNWSRTPGRTNFTNSQLVELVKRAYGDPNLPNQGVENQPDWMVRGRFDVIVQYPIETPAETLNLMMRQLLMDRFKLAAHFEPREVTGYVLVRARSDGRLGPRIGSPLPGCNLAMNGNPPAGDGPECGPGDNPGLIKFGNIRMSTVAALLQRRLGRRIVDRTDLVDSYRVELKYTLPRVLLEAPDPATAARLALEADAPELFFAVQEQLGLKLDEVKNQTQVLIIDHIEPPTAD